MVTFKFYNMHFKAIRIILPDKQIVYFANFYRAKGRYSKAITWLLGYRLANKTCHLKNARS